MKILHLSAYALRGGCEKNCFHFINGSKTNSHEVVVFGEPGPMSEEWSELGVVVTHMHILKSRIISFKNQLQKLLHGKRYDLVICWSTIRLPIQLHCLQPVTSRVKVYLGNPIGRNHNLLKDVILDFLFPTNVEVELMACSRHVSQSYKNARYFSKFAHRISLNPVPLPERIPQVVKNQETFKLGMVARLDPIKDHGTVIRAFKKIKAQISTAELHLVGDGILRHGLEKLVDQLSLSGVVFHGDVKDVYAHLRTWDLFVYATTKEEGLGSVVAEAMANGLPCVLSDLPMLRELAPDKELAVWFNEGNSDALAEQVLHLYQNEQLRAHLGEQAFLHAQKAFDTQRFINDYTSI